MLRRLSCLPLQVLGENEDINQVIAKLDIDGNGLIDFDEFLEMMRG